MASNEAAAVQGDETLGQTKRDDVTVESPTGELSSEVEIRTSELLSEITTADIPSAATTDEVTAGELPTRVTAGELPSEITTGEFTSEVTTDELTSEVEVTTGELLSEITTLEIPSVSDAFMVGYAGEWGEGYDVEEFEAGVYGVRGEGEGYEGGEGDEGEEEWDESEDEEDIEEAVESIGSEEFDESENSKLSAARSTVGATSETQPTEGEEEEEEFGEEEEEEEPSEEDLELKRLRDYHAAVLEQHKLMKIKNICLKKKLTKSFKKKKIDYALSDIKGTRDLQKRYRQKLVEFEEEEQIMTENTELIAAKWELIKEQTLLERTQLDEAMEDLYERQRQIGASLIDVKTGKPINKKIVEDLIVQQANLAAQMSQVRLCYIKLKNSVASKKAEIKLDHLGTDFHLMDYEQLCKDKEDYSDKIISRDLELKEVNQKAKEMKDFLDQVKTVSDDVQSMTENQFYTLEELDQKLIEARENTNSLKERRHYTLEEIDRIKHNSGLLTHPDLLYDYEDTAKAVVEASKQLEILKEISENQKSNSRRLRKIVEKKKGRCSVIKAKEY